MLVLGVTSNSFAGGDSHHDRVYHGSSRNRHCRLRMPARSVTRITNNTNIFNQVNTINNVNNIDNFNEFITNEVNNQIIQQTVVKEEAPQERFRYYVGGDVRFWEISDKAGAEVQYRYWPKVDTKDEEHNVGLVFKFDWTDSDNLKTARAASEPKVVDPSRYQYGE